MAFADLVTGIDRAVQGHLGSVDVLYTPDRPELGDPVIVKGLFDANSVLVAQGETGTEILGPAVFLRLEDLPVHPDDDEPIITIAGKDYRVRERQTDSLGGIRLLLVASS